jgi:hypothetical protein
VCTAPIAYKGHQALARDIDNLKAAPSARPGTIIVTWLGLLSSAQRSAVVETALASVSGAIAGGRTWPSAEI